MKKQTISSLSKKADKLVSEYIRKRDAILTTWWLDYIKCITCWQVKEYKLFDAWHFISRSNRSTRWQEQNINAQCKVCNCWGWWRQYEHGKAIDKKYWEWTADTLIKLWNQTQKVTIQFLENILEEYQEKLNNLKLN